MPGWPPKRTMLPGTIPPPRTRFSSRSGDSSRFTSPATTLSSEMGRGPLPTKAFGAFPPGGESFTERQSVLLSRRSFLVFTTFSSTRVFHSLQDWHWPIHFGDSVPQARQKKVVFVFAMNLYINIFICE